MKLLLIAFLMLLSASVFSQSRDTLLTAKGGRLSFSDSARNNGGVLELRKNGVWIAQFTLPSATSSALEYFDIVKSNSDYTVATANGTLQNIIIDNGTVTSNVNLILQTPASNAVVYVSNTSTRNLITNVSFYYNDGVANTVISAGSVTKLIYSTSKAKWYAINVQ